MISATTQNADSDSATDHFAQAIGDALGNRRERNSCSDNIDQALLDALFRCAPGDQSTRGIIADRVCANQGFQIGIAIARCVATDLHGDHHAEVEAMLMAVIAEEQRLIANGWD